jgi:hypothetical protein
MTPPKRQRTPRKTPPGAKPKPRKVSDADLAVKQDFDTREQQLGQAGAEIAHALTLLHGERNRWRTAEIDPRYQMTAADRIADDGTIVRGEG